MRKPARPALVTVLAILQLVFGALLLACGALSVISTVAGSSTATVTIRNGNNTTTRTYDVRAEMEREAPTYKSFLIGGTVVDLLLHLMMVGGGIGLLMMQAWGWWLSLAWAALRFVYQLATAGYLWFVAMPAANRVAKGIPHFNDAAGTLVNTNTFFHLFWALSATAFALYPLLILILLLLPPAMRAFVRPGYEAEPDRGEYEEDEDRPRRRRARDDDEEDEAWPQRR